MARAIRHQPGPVDGQYQPCVSHLPHHRFTVSIGAGIGSSRHSASALRHHRGRAGGSLKPQSATGRCPGYQHLPQPYSGNACPHESRRAVARVCHRLFSRHRASVSESGAPDPHQRPRWPQTPDQCAGAELHGNQQLARRGTGDRRHPHRHHWGSWFVLRSGGDVRASHNVDHPDARPRPQLEFALVWPENRFSAASRQELRT